MPLLSVEETLALFLVFGRVGGLLFFVPPFAGKVVPVQLRVGLSFLLAYVICSSVPTVVFASMHFSVFLLSMLYEVIIGFLLGFIIRIFFFTIEFAGQVMSTEMGLMISSSFNPSSEGYASTVTNVFFYFGIVLFFVVGAHYSVLQGLVRSFHIVPAGQIFFLSFESMSTLVRATSELFLVGLQVAAPIIGVNFLVNLTFSILGKAVPRMNVFMTSFSVRIMAGFMILTAALAVITHYLTTQLGREAELMLRVIAS
jgi:flagellar biosynthetic protein FliR